MDFWKIYDNLVDATVLYQFYWYVIECIVIVSMTNSLLGGQICTDKVDINIDEENTKEVDKNRLVIVPHLNFTCNGRLTSIMARVKQTGDKDDNNLFLQVWRQAADDAKIYNKISEATLILQSSYPVDDDDDDDDHENDDDDDDDDNNDDSDDDDDDDDDDRIANFIFADNMTVDVKLGDVVGYYHPNDTHYIIKDKRSDGYQLYEFKMLPSMNSVDLSEHNSSDIHNNRQPLIQFSMGKCVFLFISVGIIVDI